MLFLEIILMEKSSYNEELRIDLSEPFPNFYSACFSGDMTERCFIKENLGLAFSISSRGKLKGFEDGKEKSQLY